MKHLAETIAGTLTVIILAICQSGLELKAQVPTVKGREETIEIAVEGNVRVSATGEPFVEPTVMTISVDRYILLTALLINPGNALAQGRTDAPTLSGRLHSLINARFPATQCPGLSVAVAAHNLVVFSQAFGMSDLEQGVRLTPRSAHRLASLSKLVTGTIIMELVQNGKLELDTSVRKYLPELPISYQNITIRHLLTHQAGVRSYRDDEEVFSAVHYPTSRAALKAFVNDPLLFVPGTKTEYSTYGFTLLGAVAEAVTGRTFQELSREFFLRHRVSGFSLDDPLILIPGRVRGYRVDEHGTTWNARAYDPSNKYPAGGFVSSAEAYLRFVLAVSSGEILASSTVRDMWSAQKRSDGSLTPFGLGWGVGKLRGNRMVGFNGLQPGSTTFMRFFPDAGIGVVLACNAEGGHDLDKLLDNILEVALPTKK